jgi:hypothetical protein
MFFLHFESFILPCSFRIDLLRGAFRSTLLLSHSEPEVHHADHRCGYDLARR